MAKKTAAAAPKSGSSKNFEERLERLEKLGEQIRKTDIPLDEALKAFEEGIRLARALESDLEKIENRIEILMNSADAPITDSPDLDLFNSDE
ncbi:MAG: exodeoxyribonuclease VII small subunit [Treponema sp.]|nr:exodeoxyribonuclease VII small subunit [Treponema sp.]